MYKTTRQRTAGCPCWQHYAGRGIRPLRFPCWQPRQRAPPFPLHQNEESHAVRCNGKRSAVQWQTQRAAMTDAAHCKDPCSALHFSSQCHHSSREPSCSHSTTVLCHPKGRRARHLRPRQKRNRAGFQMESSPFLGRDDKTRTCDLAPPRRVRYQLRYIPLPFICTAKVR